MTIDVLQNGDYTVLALNGTCADSIPFLVECVQISCQDYDGDGVNDIADLDSDDDGILDTIECPLQYPVLNPSFLDDSEWRTNGGWSLGSSIAQTTSTNVTDRLIAQQVGGLDDACSNFIRLHLDIASTGHLDDVMSADTAELELTFDDILIAKILNPANDSFGYVSQIGDSVKVDASVFPISRQASIDYYRMTFYIDWSTLPENGDFIINHTGQRDVFYIDNVEFEFLDCGVASDRDGDGIPNCLDLDSDNDGIPDEVEGCGSIFTSTITYTQTASGCSSGLIDGKGCTPLDSDEDGVYNFIDLDSDNDGIWDGLEAGHGDSIDVDGRIYQSDMTSGTNGLYDALETFADSDTLAYAISDSEDLPDGIYDPYEVDSDDDGCFDVYEVNFNDDDNDGIVETGAATVDLDGLVVTHTYSLPPLLDRWQDASIIHCEICKTTLTNPHVMFFRRY